MATTQSMEPSAPHGQPPSDAQAAPPHASAPPARRGFRGRLLAVLEGVPTLLTVLVLAGLLYWGHHSGWSLPSLATLLGRQPPAEAAWCATHNVPEAACVACNPALLPAQPTFGWCAQHGVAECVLCHPELAQVQGEPRLPAYDTVAALAVVPRATNDKLVQLHEAFVQLASAEAADKLGLEIDLVQERPMTEALEVHGEVEFAPAALAHLSSRAAGSVWRVYRSVGDSVSRGECLALVDAASIGQSKTQLVQAVIRAQVAQRNLTRLQSVAEAVPGKTLLEAETARDEAQINLLSAQQVLRNLGFVLPTGLAEMNAQQAEDALRYLGLPDELQESIRQETQSSNLVPVVAPLEGVIVSSDIVAGEVVDSKNILFAVADPRQMWLMLHAQQEDAPLLRAGLLVEFRTEDGSQQASGAIDWISPTIDEKTRTLHVRVPVANSDRQLRDKAFGSGRVILRQEARAIVVPKSAVHATTGLHLIFVRDQRWFEPDAPKLFRARQVRIGAVQGDYVELLAGALPGEVVATEGSNILLAQLLRENFGPGCGCHH